MNTATSPAIDDQTYDENIRFFNGLRWQRMNARRLEQLAALGLAPTGQRVLEVGAGIGDMTSFFLDRGNDVVCTDGRPELVATIERRFAGEDRLRTRVLNMDQPDETWDERFDFVFCYGLLYHLRDPGAAIGYLASRCDGVLMLETHVDPGAGSEVRFFDERAEELSLSVEGVGCAPTRSWVVDRLGEHFPHAGVTSTQPSDRQYPTDWTVAPETRYHRAVFAGSRSPLDPSLFSERPLMRQARA